MTTTEKIADIFSWFHDGTLIEWHGNLKKLSLTVDIQYAAEYLAPDFKNFYVELFDIETLRCEPWGEEATDSIPYETLFSEEIEINTADVKDDYAVITYLNNDFPTTGGFIYIKAGNVKLYQHDRKEITVEDIIKASKRYRNNFKK